MSKFDHRLLLDTSRLRFLDFSLSRGIAKANSLLAKHPTNLLCHQIDKDKMWNCKSNAVCFIKGS